MTSWLSDASHDIDATVDSADSTLQGVLDTVRHTAAHDVDDLTGSAAALVGHGGGNTDPAVKKKKKKADDTEEEPTEAQIIGSQFEQMGEGLVAENEAETAQVEDMIAGTGTGAQAQQNYANQLAGLGTGGTGATSAWMNAQIAQGTKNADPVTQAMQSYASAYATGQGMFDLALANMGVANDAYISTSPYAGVLQTAETAAASPYLSKVGAGSKVWQSLPIAIQYELYQIYGNPYGIEPPAGGWPKYLTAGSSNTEITGNEATLGDSLASGSPPSTTSNENASVPS